MTIVDSVDVTGDGAIHTISSLLAGVKYAKWIQVQAVSVGATATRVGGSSISTTRGAVCAAGGSLFFPAIAELTSFYDLSVIYYLVQTGDKVAITCGS